MGKRSRMCVVLTFIAILATAFFISLSDAIAAPRVEPEIPFAGEVPIPPNVRPVILLVGSDYDMGYQFYRQLVQVFGQWILKGVADDKFTEKEADQKDKHEAHIKQYAPEMIDMFKGMAKAATEVGVPLSYEDVMAHFVRKKVQSERPSSDCSALAAWKSATKNGKMIAAGSTDHELTFEITIMAFPKNGANFIISPFGPTEFGRLGGHPGINNKGLAYVHHGATHWIKSKPQKEWTIGVTEGIANLHTLRFATTAAEAKDMQLAYPSGDGFIGGFWADISGDAYVIESHSTPRALRKAGDYGERDFIYSTNNGLCKELAHCQSPPKQGNVYIQHGGWLGSGATISSNARNLELWNMLQNYHGQVDLDFVKMVWRFPGEAPSYKTLEEADAVYYKTQGAGWHQKVADLENALVGIVIPDNGNEGTYYVASGSAARVAYPLVPQGHYYRPDMIYSFYQLKLAANPKDAVKAAKDRAQYEMYYANQEMKKLGYRDAAYAPLAALFNQAATEYAKGNFYQTPVLEGKTSGVETVDFQGKALRAFTKSQAYAREAYESLVPQPTRPEDLGLKPWGYWNR